MPARVLLLVILLLQLAPGPLSVAAAPAPDIRENLEYQVSLGPWSDVARVHLVLKELEPGHYLAEFSGAAQGMWQLLSRWLPERYQTEMVFREGRLRPPGLSGRIYQQGQARPERVPLRPRARPPDPLAPGRRRREVKEWEVPLTGPGL